MEGAHQGPQCSVSSLLPRLQVLRGHYEPISEDYSPELRDVVSKMLCNNVNARPFIFQLIEMPTIMQRAMTYLRCDFM